MWVKPWGSWRYDRRVKGGWKGGDKGLERVDNTLDMHGVQEVQGSVLIPLFTNIIYCKVGMFLPLLLSICSKTKSN